MNEAQQPGIAAEAFDRVQGRLGDRPKTELVFPYVANFFLSRKVRHILDVGCGNGAFCRYGALGGLKLDGADLSSELLERARQRDASENVRRTYYCLDAANLTDAILGQYDGISSIFSLQDMIAPSKFLSAVASNAPRGAILMVICESYFYLTNPRIPHSVARTLEKRTGYDGATHISKARWGNETGSITYCRPDRFYIEAARRSGLKIEAVDYTGTIKNYLRCLNIVFRASRPFFCMTCSVP